MMTHARIHYPFLLFVILTSALFGLLRFDSFQVGAYTDDAHYIVLAESLATGQGYRLINYPKPQPEWAFPPGWPILLSPLVTLFPGNYQPLKFISWILWLISIFLVYKLFSNHIKSPYLEMIVALVAINPKLIGASTMVNSETAYLFLSILTLYLFELYNQEDKKNWRLTIVFTLTALYTSMIRTIGLSILLATVLHLLLSRHFGKARVVTGIFSLGLFVQFLFNFQNSGTFISPTYQSFVFGNPILAKLERIILNFQGYANGMIANTIVPIFGPNFTSIFDQIGIGIVLSLIYLLFSVVLLLGIIFSLSSFQVSILYVGVYFLGVLSWSPDSGIAITERYLIPIIPFLYFYLLYAVERIATLLPSKKHRLLIVWGITLLIVGVALGRNLQDWRNPIRNRITDLSVGTIWIRNNTPPEAIVMSRDPVPSYLYARRRTVNYPPKGQDFEEYIRANQVTHILVAPRLQTPRTNQLGKDFETLYLPILAQQEVFRIVYMDSTHNVTVYEYQGYR